MDTDLFRKEGNPRKTIRVIPVVVLLAQPDKDASGRSGVVKQVAERGGAQAVPVGRQRHKDGGHLFFFYPFTNRKKKTDAENQSVFRTHLVGSSCLDVSALHHADLPVASNGCRASALPTVLPFSRTRPAVQTVSPGIPTMARDKPRGGPPRISEQADPLVGGAS